MPALTSYILLTEPDASNSPGKNLEMNWKLEQTWSKIRFDAVDVLHICPFNAWLRDSKYIFGIGDNCTEQNPMGDYTERFEWIVRRARQMNPNILIIPMQMHNGGDFSKLKDNIDDYTTSVATLIKSYLYKTAPSPVAGQAPIQMRLDGYDVDYEWGGDDRALGSGNYQTYAADILAQVRTKIDAVETGRKFYVSISAADTTGIVGTNAAESLDYVKMQTYDGGVRDPDKYLEDLKAGSISPAKLVYGISTEWPPNNETALSDVVQLVKTKNYGGLMTWRLNSDNLIYQSAVQVFLFNHFNTTKIREEYSEDDVLNWWNGPNSMGGRVRDPENPWKMNWYWC